GREAGRPRHGREAVGPAVHHLRSRTPPLFRSAAHGLHAEQREVVLARLEADAGVEERVEKALGHDRRAVDRDGRLPEETELAEQSGLRRVPRPADRLLRPDPESAERRSRAPRPSTEAW